MKIERFASPQETIESFAERLNLIMQIRERPRYDGQGHWSKLPKYYAHFKSSEIKDGPILKGAYGNGETEEEAIRNYATEISGQLLVIDAMGDERREIWVPDLK